MQKIKRKKKIVAEKGAHKKKMTDHALQNH